MALIRVRKVATGAGPWLLDEHDERLGTIFVPWDETPPVEIPSSPFPTSTPPTGLELAHYLSLMDGGLTHAVAFAMTWPGVEIPPTPTPELFIELRARALVAEHKQNEEPPKRERKSRNNVSAYDPTRKR